MKERQEGIASNKAGQSQVWQRRQEAEVCKQQGNCLEASAEVYNTMWPDSRPQQRQYSAVCETDTYIQRERKTTDGQCVPNNGIQERYAGRQM